MATPTQIRRRGRFSLILGTLVAALMVAAVAYADDLIVDDGLTSTTPDRVEFGEVCQNSTQSQNVTLKAIRSSGGGWANSAVLTVTTNVTGDSAGVLVSGGSFSVDSNWTSLSNGTKSTNSLGSTISVPTSTLGEKSANVTWTATGARSSTPPPTHSDSVNAQARWTVVECAPPDATPPTSSASAKKADNTDYTFGDWTNQNVTVTLTAQDNVGGSGVKEIRYTLDGTNPAASSTLYTAPFTISTEGTTTVKFRAEDNAGNVEAVNTELVRIDKTPPNPPTASVSPTPNAAGWNNSVPVTVSYASDGDAGAAAAQSGVAGCTADQAFNAETAAAGTLTSGTCTDVAGNTSAATSVTIKIDLTDPSVEITSPADGLNTIASSINVSGTASDTPSGIASVTVNSSAATGTFSRSDVALACGANVITALATDVAGRTKSDSITVNRLCFTFEYLKPLEQSYGVGSVVLNDGKYGRVVPVKGIVKLGGVAQTLADLDGYGLTLRIGVNSVLCTGGEATDTVEEYADAGQANGGTNMFRWLYSTDNSWGYNLDTKAPPDIKMEINKCYRLDAYVQDTATPANKVKISNSPYAVFRPIK